MKKLIITLVQLIKLNDISCYDFYLFYSEMQNDFKNFVQSTPHQSTINSRQSYCSNINNYCILLTIEKVTTEIETRQKAIVIPKSNNKQ